MAVVSATANGGAARLGEAVKEPEADVEVEQERLNDA